MKQWQEQQRQLSRKNIADSRSSLHGATGIEDRTIASQHRIPCFDSDSSHRLAKEDHVRPGVGTQLAVPYGSALRHATTPLLPWTTRTETTALAVSYR